MKFLIDAHLPPGLRQVFATAGQEAIHTMDTLVELDRQRVSIIA